MVQLLTNYYECVKLLHHLLMLHAILSQQYISDVRIMTFTLIT
jgi:hypothetical protein